MKKVISVLLLIASILSFYIVYEAEVTQYTKSIEEIEMNLPNSYKIMIPVNIDNKDKSKMYKSMISILDKYDGGIYYDRVSKDESTRIKYMYDKGNMYISNIELMDGEKLTSDTMETNKYLSTRKGEDELQIGRIATFNVRVKVLASFIDSKIVIKYPYKDSWGCTVPQNSL